MFLDISQNKLNISLYLVLFQNNIYGFIMNTIYYNPIVLGLLGVLKIFIFFFFSSYHNYGFKFINGTILINYFEIIYMLGNL